MAAPTQWRLDAGVLTHEGEPKVRIERVDVASSTADIWYGEPLPDGEQVFVVWEWTEYKVWIDDETPWHVAAGDDVVREVHRNVFLLLLANSIGLSRLCIRNTDGRQLTVWFEVTSRKLSSNPGDLHYHRTFLATVVNDLFRRIAYLPFDLSGATHLGTATGEDEGHDLFRLHLLSREAARLGMALRQITAQPHRTLAKADMEVPLERVRRLGRATLERSLRTQQAWQRTPESWHDYGYPVAPLHLAAEVSKETFDTTENRFVRHFVEHIEFLLRSRLDDMIHRMPESSQRILEELQDAVAMALRAPVLAEAKAMQFLPSSSQVLLTRSGYATVFELYPPFLLGPTPLARHIGSAIAQRKVSDLYEMWTFFAISERLAGHFGRTSLEVVMDDKGLPYGTTARFAEGKLALVYNRSFAGGHGSYSVTLRPDIAVLVGNRVVGAFDAKFRIEQPEVGASAPSGGVPDDVIHKMHTYRDALSLRFATGLHPGDDEDWYQQMGDKPPPGPVSLIEDEEFSGVGALSLRPGEVE